MKTKLKSAKLTLIFLFFSIPLLISTDFTKNSLSNSLFIALVTGSALVALSYFFEKALKTINLHSFNATVLGVFVGFLLGKTLTNAVNFLAPYEEPAFLLHLINSSLMLISIYFGVTFTIKNANEISFSIPFVRFLQKADKKRDLLLDASVLSDPRIIDLAATGLVDGHLVIPRFVLNDIKAKMESSDEPLNTKAKRSLDVYKKLESSPNLNIRLTDSEFSDIEDVSEKMIRSARLIDANILTADMSRIQSSEIEGIKIINIHSLSNALKPLMQTGERLLIKIQRYGKESRQGVGYLDDGTMVVVNGGGDFIGQSIYVTVLSVKHTSSGRMIFCNTIENNQETSYSNESISLEQRTT
ncbi:MAG: TRAM domain-containing protein [Chlamydiota bacterium]|jgi:uncharacterized protein YacL